MLWQILLVSVAVYGVYLCWKMRKFIKIHEQLPVNLKSAPILGHAIHLRGDARERMKGFQELGRDTVDNFGGITSIWLAYKFIVVVADPVIAELILKTCLEKDEINDMSHQLLGKGSIFAPVSIWRPRRKFLAPIFSQKTLNSFVKIFSKQASIFTDQLKIVFGNGNLPIFENLSKYAMDSVSETVLGIQMNSQRIANHPFLKNFNKNCDLTADRMLKPWLYPNAIYRWHWNYPQFMATSEVLKQFVAKIIKSKRQIMNEENNNKEDPDESDQQAQKTRSMVELLIQAGGDKGFTDLELQEETLTMLLAGTDTSSVGASFAALAMAKYPDIQEKVYQEIIEVFGDSDKPIQPEDLGKLKYLDAVIRETLRMYPPVPVIVRRVEKDITLASGVTLVPGVCVLIHIWAMHRNKKYWGADANVFRPERFLEGPVKHQYAYIPFSGGPRNCLGALYATMSMKTVLVHLVRRYRLLPKQAPDGDTEEKEIPVTFEIMMKHADKFELLLEKRN